MDTHEEQTDEAYEQIEQETLARRSLRLLKGIGLSITKSILLISLAYGGIHYLTGRRLNDQETLRLKRVFKDSINYESVKIHTLPGWVSKIFSAEGATFFNDVFLHQELVEGPFDQVSENERETFFHEMEHVRRRQDGNLSPFHYYKDLISRGFNRAAVYEYSYWTQKFGEMNPEAQAEFIANYAEDLSWYDDGLEEIRRSRQGVPVRIKSGLLIASPGVTLWGACSAFDLSARAFDEAFPFDESVIHTCAKFEKIRTDEEFHSLPEQEQWKLLDELLLER